MTILKKSTASNTTEVSDPGSAKRNNKIQTDEKNHLLVKNSICLQNLLVRGK